MQRLLLVTLLLMFISCKGKQEKMKPTLEKITASVYASGIIKSNNQYQVFSTASGLIEQLYVTEGDVVKKGDPIMRLTNTTARLNKENARLSFDYSAINANKEKLDELQNSIDLAKIKMNNDAQLLHRQQNLWKEQIGTRNELDQRELSYKSSLNAYEAAKLRYAEMKKQISFQQKQSQKLLDVATTVASDYTIKSEVDGKVYSMLKEAGEMVNSQSPVAVIGDAKVFLAELQVDEYDIAKTKTGQQVVLSMDSYKGQVFEAVISKINPMMNDRSKSFTIEATFVHQPPALYPNLTCEANIVISQKENAITIPRSYLMQGDSVLLENKQKRKVTTGLSDYQKVEIISGISVNDVLLQPAP